VVNAHGDLVSPLTAVLGQSQPAKLCAATIPVDGSFSVPVPLLKDTSYVQGAQLDVGVLMQGHGTVEVQEQNTDGFWQTPLRYSDDAFPAGAHTLRVPVPLGRGVHAVRVSSNSGATSCITYVRVWAPFA
jgi:hypothetical protein